MALDIGNQRFGRVVKVVLETRGRPVETITGHRVQFDVRKYSTELADNRATIRFFNLASKTRSVLARRLLDKNRGPHTTIFLSAGYEDATALLFRGVVVRGVNTKIGPDWATEVNALTAVAQTSSVFFGENDGYRNTPADTIASLVFSKLKWGNPVYSPEALEALRAAGMVTQSFSGNVARGLSEFLAGYGLAFTINEDGPVVVKIGGPVDPETLVPPTISPENGLIGSPEITETGVRAKALLTHEIRILHRFIVKSDTISETLRKPFQEYTAHVVRHTGDTHGEPWWTEVSGSYYPEIQVPIQSPETPPAYTDQPPVGQ